jgi:hypothetical protein
MKPILILLFALFSQSYIQTETSIWTVKLLEEEKQITIFDSIDIALEILGKPTKIEEYKYEEGSVLSMYVFEGLEVLTWSFDARVYQISIDSDRFELSNGLRVGQSMDGVLKKFEDVEGAAFKSYPAENLFIFSIPIKNFEFDRSTIFIEYDSFGIIKIITVGEWNYGDF